MIEKIPGIVGLDYLKERIQEIFLILVTAGTFNACSNDLDKKPIDNNNMVKHEQELEKNIKEIEERYGVEVSFGKDGKIIFKSPQERVEYPNFE